MDPGIIDRPVDANARAEIDRLSLEFDTATTIDTPGGQICQFIADKPTTSDDCKCGRPTKPGSSYCLHHHAICWITREEDWSDTLNLE